MRVSVLLCYFYFWSRSNAVFSMSKNELKTLFSSLREHSYKVILSKKSKNGQVCFKYILLDATAFI